MREVERMPGNRTSSSCLTRLRRETVKQVNLCALNGLRQAVVLRPIDRAKIPHPSAVTTNDTRLTLTVNAMDAMSDMPSAERKITVRTKRFHGLAEATILDAGSGIPPDMLI